MTQSSLFGSTAPVPIPVPRLILRGYQSACVDKILWAMKFPDNDLIVLPTGAGKSVVIAAVADAMKVRKILILQPSKEILEQNYGKLRAFMPDHLIGIYSASMKRKDINQITFATIQSVYKYPELFQDIGLVIIDECDLKNEKKDDSMYTSFIRAINNPKTIGFTATPYRNVIGYVEEPDGFGGSVLMARTTLKLINRMKAGRDRPIFWKRLLFNINNKDLVAAGFLAPLRYESIDPIKQEEMEVNKSGSDFVLEAFEAKLSEKEESIVKYLRIAMEKHRSILVFCSSINQAKKLSRITPDIERVSDYVTGTTPADERAEIINGFRDGSIQIVFNVGVLTVGFDHPALDCIFLIRPTRSLRLYYQMCLDRETEILTRRGWMKYDEYQPDDIVATMDLADGSIQWSPIRNSVHRALVLSESFISAKGPHIDFRVTDRHDLLARNKTCKRYLKRTAESLMDRKDMIYLPISGIESRRGANLTKAELRFLGIFLSDGSLHKATKAITIVQSLKHPAIIKQIETILRDCGFKYGKVLNKRKGLESRYPDTYHFTISYGQPRGRDKDKRGWKDLEPFIDKDLNENYERLSAAQVGYLLQGIHLGDGDKATPTDYIKKSFRIALGDNQVYADRLQSLLIRSGYKCNLTTQPGYYGRIQYLAYVSHKAHITLPGSNTPDNLIEGKSSKRTRLQRENPEQLESVWCVETDQGTLITRRNGKVLIMGNCGRGVRTAPGKEYCQIYDFSNTIKQLGPIESIQMVKENRPGDRPGTYPKWEVVTDTEAGRKYWHGAALYQWVVKDIAPRRSNEPQLPSPFDRSNDLAF